MPILKFYFHCTRIILCYNRYENAHDDNKCEAKVIGVERKSQFLAVP